jgi:hypothetical protein
VMLARAIHAPVEWRRALLGRRLRRFTVPKRTTIDMGVAS